MERYVFRPFGKLAIFGFVLCFILFIAIAARASQTEPAGESAERPPTLYLSVAGDLQQAVHYARVRDFDDIQLRSPLVAPLHVLPVTPYEWLKIYTNSPLGLPRSARARIYRSGLPERCYGEIMIGCVEIDTHGGSRTVPLHPDFTAGFGFQAPSAPGSYWIALDADWGFGGRTQVFVIDVRA